MVGLDVEVYAAATEQFPAQMDRHFKVAVVAAADDERRRERGIHAQVHVLAPPDAKDGLLGRDIQVRFEVVQVAKFRNQATGAGDDGDDAFFRPGCRLAESLQFPGIEQPFVTALVQAAEQQGGILAAVPAQILVYEVPEFLLAPVTGSEIEEAGLQAPHMELLLEEIRCAGEISGHIAVQGDDGRFPQGGGLRRQEREHFHAALDQGLDRTCFQPRPVHRLRVVVRERIIHEAHRRPT